MPKGWSEVTIEQYQDFCDFKESEESISDIVYLISIFSRMPIDELEDMPIDEIKQAYRKLEFLKEYPTKFKNSFRVKGKKYLVEVNVKKISASQYIDHQTFLKEGVNPNLHKIMAVFCLPAKLTLKGWKPLKYNNGYDATDVALDFKRHLTMDVVFPLSFFFSELLHKSMPIIADYLKQESKNLTAKLEQIKASHLQSTGDG